MFRFTLNQSYATPQLLDSNGYECIIYKRSFGEGSVFEAVMCDLLLPFFPSITQATFYGVKIVVMIRDKHNHQPECFCGLRLDETERGILAFTAPCVASVRDLCSMKYVLLNCIKCAVMDLFYDWSDYRSLLLHKNGVYKIVLYVDEQQFKSAPDADETFKHFLFHSVEDPEALGVTDIPGKVMRVYDGSLMLEALSPQPGSPLPEPTSPSEDHFDCTHPGYDVTSPSECYCWADPSGYSADTSPPLPPNSPPPLPTTDMPPSRKRARRDE